MVVSEILINWWCDATYLTNKKLPPIQQDKNKNKPAEIPKLQWPQRETKSSQGC